MEEHNKQLVDFLEYYRTVWGDDIYLPKFKKNQEAVTDAKVENVRMNPADKDTEKRKRKELDDFYKQIKDCTKCSLGSSRTNFVFGVGSPDARILLIGEAPGRDEDLQGEPFVGRAGQLLNKILKAISFEREDVYIANILKCRPPNNRDPLPEEIELCEPYLKKQIDIIKPDIILALGRISGQTLLRAKSPLKDLRQKIHFYQNIRLLVTYHPAALLRNPNNKRPTWEDVQLLKRIYDEI
jgi:DNA polymerase